MDEEGRTCGPLCGVRVADFSVHAAGPFAGLMLAELGAQVIKIESAARLDITRRPHSMYGKPPSSFEQVNANKLSACLNLKEPRAVDFALELVRISDLVLENFRPGVMDRLGLGYPQLSRIKPDIILVSLSSNGQTGPEKGYAGYAPMFSALGGLGHLTGYPDGPPVELRHAMDHTGGVLAAFCAVAALCARFPLSQRGALPQNVILRSEATKNLGRGESRPVGTPQTLLLLRKDQGDTLAGPFGAKPQRGVRGDFSEGGSPLGQHVDVSVRDLATAFIGPALLDYSMNRRETHRQGNRDEVAAPQGVYPCWGKDAWVSISVASEEEWHGLVRALGHPLWAKEPKFGDAYQRWLNQDELDRKLGDWSLGFTPQEVTERLQGEGVAAIPSLAANQLMVDSHLQARDAFPDVVHPGKGRQRAVSPPWRFSATPARVDRWTPDLGEHNLEVFHGLLGLGVAEVKALEEARVIW